MEEKDTVITAKEKREAFLQKIKEAAKKQADKKAAEEAQQKELFDQLKSKFNNKKNK